MTTKKKLLIALLSVSCITCAALSLTACKKKDTRDQDIVAIYNLYVQYQQENNKEALSYDDWVLQVTGEQGDKGDSGLSASIGSNGNWYLGDKDTGVAAAGQTGSTGNKGNDGKNGNNGKDANKIESITKDSAGNYVLTYADGTTVTSSTLGDTYQVCKVTTVDTDGNAVADVYLELYYYNKVESKTTILYKAKTNEKGEAYFLYQPESGTNYSIRLQQDLEEISPTPNGYEIIKDGDFATYSVPETNNLTIKFNNIKNTFSYAVNNNLIKKIPYTSAYDFSSSEENPAPIVKNKTTNGRFKIDLTQGNYQYLYFLPFVSPKLIDVSKLEGSALDAATATNEANTQKARAAATGKYKITVSGGATLYYFKGTTTYAPTDTNGIPIVNDNGTSNSSGELTVNVSSDTATAELIFGLLPTGSDCTVTITVERIGDAYEKPTPTLIEVSVPSGLTKQSNNVGGELNLVPINGRYQVALESDGYYHIQSGTHPIVYVQLTKSVERYSDYSLQNFGNSKKDMNDYIEGSEKTVFYLNGLEDSDYNEEGDPIYTYDFNKVVETYSSYANAAGVYPVDQTLYTLLQCLARQGTGIKYMDAADGYQWLLPCYYPGELPMNGSGTTADPYTAYEGKNTVVFTNLNGTAQVKFTATEAGVYGFYSEDGTIDTSLNCIKKLATEDKENVLYVLVDQANTEIPLTVTSTLDSCELDIYSRDSIQAVYLHEKDANNNDVDKSEGITQDKPISKTGTNVGTAYYVKFDNGVAQEDNFDGIYLSFLPMLSASGTYAFELITSSGSEDRTCWIEYDNNRYYANSTTVLNISDLTNSGSTKTSANIVINSSTTETTFMLYVYKVS